MNTLAVAVEDQFRMDAEMTTPRTRMGSRYERCFRSKAVSALALGVAAYLMPSVMPARAAVDAARGQPLYQRYCSGCHGVDGQGGGKNFMPHVGALTKKGYIDLLEDDYLATVIAGGAKRSARVRSCRPGRRRCRNKTLPM